MPTISDVAKWAGVAQARVRPGLPAHAHAELAHLPAGSVRIHGSVRLRLAQYVCHVGDDVDPGHYICGPGPGPVDGRAHFGRYEGGGCSYECLKIKSKVIERNVNHES